MSANLTTKLAQLVQGITYNGTGIGIGMSAVNILDITQSQNNPSRISLLNGDPGTAARGVFSLGNGTSNAGLILYGASYTTSTVQRQDGAELFCAGAGGLTLGTTVFQPLYFIYANAEVGRWTSTGLGIGMTPARALDVTGTFGATGAAVLGSTLSVATSVTIAHATTSRLYVGNLGGEGSSYISMLGSNSAWKNWQISTSTTTGNGLEFTPSTAAGGQTFTTPFVTMTPTAVGIGMAPSNILDITQNQNAASVVSILNNNASAAAASYFIANNGTAAAQFGQLGTGYTTNGVLVANRGYIFQNNAAGFAMASSGPLIFAGSGLTEGMRLTSTGLGIGKTPGVALDVSGAATISGVLTGSSATFTGNLTLDSANAQGPGALIIGNGSLSNGAAVKFLGALTQHNWMIGQQVNASDTLEFTPSTAGGGSTFTTPVFTLTTAAATAAVQVIGAVNGNIQFVANPATQTNAALFEATSTGGQFYIGIDSSTGGSLGAGAYHAALYTTSGMPFDVMIGGGTKVATFTTTGLGIGMTPSHSLDVTGTFGVSGAASFGSALFVGGGGTGTATPTVQMNGGSASTGGAYISFARNSVNKGYIGNDSAVTSSNSDDLAVYATGAVRFYSGSSGPNAMVASDGSFLVGTSTGAGAGNIFINGILKVQTSAAAPIGGVTLGTYNQTNSVVAARKSGMSLEFGHENTAGYGSTIGCELGTGAPYIAFCAEAGTTNNTYRTRGLNGFVISSYGPGARLTFNYVSNSNANNQSLTEMGGFGSDGSFLVGTTANGGWSANAITAFKGTGGTVAMSAYQAGTSSTAGLFRVDATSSSLANFYYSTGSVGSISTNGSVVTYGGTSDARFKNVRAQQTNFRSSIIALDMVEYDWTDSDAYGFGPLAQQAYEVLPLGMRDFFVLKPADETKDRWNVNQVAPGMLALWGVKDLYTENAELRSELDDLKTRMAAIEALLAA